MTRGHSRFAVLSLFLWSSWAGVAFAADPPVGSAAASQLELAKQVENPLARVVSVQINGNVNFDKGADERTQSLANFSVTYPIDLPRHWNLFVNATLPVIDQPVGADDRIRGFGDTSILTLVSPPGTPRWVWGAGTSIICPTAADPTLGQGKWDFGPALALVHTERTWVAGVVMSQNWSITGANDRPGVSRLIVSPFCTWHLTRGWFLFTAPAISSDWKARGSRTWTVPLGGGVGYIVRRGKHAVNFALQAYDNVIRADGAPSWQIRLTSGWVFPK
jgi:hypothetical protein